MKGMWGVVHAVVDFRRPWPSRSRGYKTFYNPWRASRTLIDRHLVFDAIFVEKEWNEELLTTRVIRRRDGH